METSPWNRTCGALSTSTVSQGHGELGHPAVPLRIPTLPTAQALGGVQGGRGLVRVCPRDRRTSGSTGGSTVST